MAEPQRERSIAITGAASGMGASCAEILRGQGHRVIGIDVRDAEIVADLGDPSARAKAVESVNEWCGGALDGIATFAGIPALTRPGVGPELISVGYHGTVDLLNALRPSRNPTIANGTAGASRVKTMG